MTTQRTDGVDPDTPWTTILWDSLREVPEAQEEPVDPPAEEQAPEPVEQ